MKKIGEYTCRGSIRSDNSINRIILDDGRFDTGYRVTDFVIAAHDMDDPSGRIYTAKLMTDDDASSGLNWNWDNNEEIGWARFVFDGNSSNNQAGEEFKLVDLDNLVIQDLFIVADEGGGADTKLNYYIRMEKYEFTDSTGALAMVRNRSQA